eukprot:GHVS01103060.1.p1 GENE.GHVS01103060.1~~GHVS01103060.1.p1  ORF type:complete len:529 (-),score=114.19 GHVS01103060.1:142-1728(-)
MRTKEMHTIEIDTYEHGLKNEDSSSPPRPSSSIPPFFCCYLLRSLTHPSSSYIGTTVHPLRRLRQHNGLRAGARRTRRYRPWEVCVCVHGFSSYREALQFEWAWQHPTKTRKLKDEGEGQRGKKRCAASAPCCGGSGPSIVSAASPGCSTAINPSPTCSSSISSSCSSCVSCVSAPSSCITPLPKKRMKSDSTFPLTSFTPLSSPPPVTSPAPRVSAARSVASRLQALWALLLCQSFSLSSLQLHFVQIDVCELFFRYLSGTRKVGRKRRKENTEEPEESELKQLGVVGDAVNSIEITHTAMEGLSVRFGSLEMLHEEVVRRASNFDKHTNGGQQGDGTKERDEEEVQEEEPGIGRSTETQEEELNEADERGDTDAETGESECFISYVLNNSVGGWPVIDVTTDDDQVQKRSSVASPSLCQRGTTTITVAAPGLAGERHEEQQAEQQHCAAGERTGELSDSLVDGENSDGIDDRGEDSGNQRSIKSNWFCCSQIDQLGNSELEGGKQGAEDWRLPLKHRLKLRQAQLQ